MECLLRTKSMSRLDALDDAQIAIGALAKNFQRLLVSRAVMRRGRLLDAVEFDNDDTLQETRLISFRGIPTREEPATWIAGPASLAYPANASGSDIER